tara:strand:- start:867 stop:1493 length:627 start_codon:yes stop_codon:yes gene_type:complete
MAHIISKFSFKIFFLLLLLIKLNPIAYSEEIRDKNYDNLKDNYLKCIAYEIMFGQHIITWEFLVEFKDKRIKSQYSDGSGWKEFGYYANVYVLEDEINSDSRYRKTYTEDEVLYKNNEEFIFFDAEFNTNFDIEGVYNIVINRQTLGIEAGNEARAYDVYEGYCEIENNLESFMTSINRIKQIPSLYQKALDQKEEDRKKELKKNQKI